MDFRCGFFWLVVFGFVVFWKNLSCDFCRGVSCDFPPWQFAFRVAFWFRVLKVFACCSCGMGGLRLSMLSLFNGSLRGERGGSLPDALIVATALNQKPTACAQKTKICNVSITKSKYPDFRSNRWAGLLDVTRLLLSVAFG